jgi:hypothetical protein
MTKQIILALALTVSLAAAAQAATMRYDSPMQTGNQTVDNSSTDQRWLDRAKGSID